MDHYLVVSMDHCCKVKKTGGFKGRVGRKSLRWKIWDSWDVSQGFWGTLVLEYPKIVEISPLTIYFQQRNSSFLFLFVIDKDFSYDYTKK